MLDTDLLTQNPFTLQTSHCVRHTASSIAPCKRCKLYTVQWTLSAIHCTLFTRTLLYKLYSAHCIHCILLMFSECIVLCPLDPNICRAIFYEVFCRKELHYVHFKLHIVYCALYNKHCTLNTEYWTLDISHWTLHTLPFSLRTIYFTLCTAHFKCTLYTAVLTKHCKLHTTHYKLNT